MASESTESTHSLNSPNSSVYTESTNSSKPVDTAGLEAAGLEKLKYLYATGTVTPDNLLKIVSDGCSEFERRNGRPITYAEMRALYG